MMRRTDDLPGKALPEVEQEGRLTTSPPMGRGQRWKDVPIPKAVARRPTDHRGFPVPWLSDWDKHNHPEGHWNIRHHRIYGPYIDCGHVDGVGTPDLGKVCPGRQIKGMAERRCGVCGGQLPASDIYWIGGKDLAVSGYTEPPMHLDCALYAAQVCPHLVTRARGPLVVAMSRAYEMKPHRRLKDGRVEVFQSLYDPRWYEMERLGKPSLLLKIVAIPVGGVETWPVEAFVQRHAAQEKRTSEPQYGHRS